MDVGFYLIGLNTSTLAMRLGAFIVFPLLNSRVPWTGLNTLRWISSRCFRFHATHLHLLTLCKRLGNSGMHAINFSACGVLLNISPKSLHKSRWEYSRTCWSAFLTAYVLAGVSVLQRHTAVGEIRLHFILPQDCWFIVLLHSYHCPWFLFSPNS